MPQPEQGGGYEPLTRLAIVATLERMGLLAPGTDPVIEPLDGGVSSEIWRVDLGKRRVCIKRALPRLKVAQRWEAPVARNRWEWAWFDVVAHICADAIPRLVAQDPAAALFVMDYLDPAAYPLWKRQLREGIAQENTATVVGERLSLIHRATADVPDIAERFRTDENFHAIRLEPYLVATSRVHRDLAAELEALVLVTATTRRVLVHGDVSPKNILVGPRGPVFLDAECAWYGDPAFDIAFCLNHLLLKCLWTPSASHGFLACFDRLAESYLAGVSWEDPAMLEARVARLLPGLFLARIDGKSPVEYVVAEEDKERVRRVARPLIADPVERLGAIRRRWTEEIGA